MNLFKMMKVHIIKHLHSKHQRIQSRQDWFVVMMSDYEQ